MLKVWKREYSQDGSTARKSKKASGVGAGSGRNWALVGVMIFHPMGWKVIEMGMEVVGTW